MSFGLIIVLVIICNGTILYILSHKFFACYVQSIKKYSEEFEHEPDIKDHPKKINLYLFKTIVAGHYSYPRSFCKTQRDRFSLGPIKCEFL